MSKVYLQKTEEREEFVRKVFELSEIKSQIEKVKKILIKPNIVSFESYPTTTHPDLLRACLRILTQAKKEIFVADGPAYDAGDSEKIIREHPLQKVCNEFNLELLNLNSQNFKKVETPSLELEISTIPFEYDFIISLPVLKAHDRCKMTGALKNQYGFLSLEQKARGHGMDIDKIIAELNQVIKPNLWIIDAIQTLIGTNEVRHGGEKRDLGYMLAGKDPVSLDIQGLKLLQKLDPRLEYKSPQDIPQIKYALDLGLGNLSYKLENLD